MYLQHKENVAEAALNGKKDEYEAFLKSVVEKGKNTPESIQQELDTYSKEQFRDMSKQIIEKQKGLFSDKIKELSLDEITKVANNIQAQISNGKDIDIKTLANCLSGPVQNTQVSGPAKPNANALKADRQAEDLTLKRDLKILCAAVQDNMNKNQDVILDNEQLSALKITATQQTCFQNNPNVKFGVKQNIGNNKFVVGRF